MNQDRKYCVDCAHFQLESEACAHPDHNRDFIYGLPRPALSARSPHGFCKPYALSFEQKPESAQVDDVERKPTAPTTSTWKSVFVRWGRK